MSTSTGSGSLLEKELVTTDDGDHDRFAHYFRKADILASAVEGAEITALCGKKDIPIRDPAKYQVCPTCKEVIETLRDE